MDPDPAPFHHARSGDRGVTVRRGFTGPGQRILRAHIDPDIVPRWLGTPDSPLVVGRIDPRPGGRFRIDRATRDDTAGVMSGQFVDLTETRIRLEARGGHDGQSGPLQLTIEIETEGHGTLLTLSLRFPDRATRDATLDGPLGPMLERAYDRLDTLVQD